jgi:hypothetical protein
MQEIFGAKHYGWEKGDGIAKSQIGIPDQLNVT